MAVTLRKILDTDLGNIIKWRMSPEVTKYMNTDPVLTLDGQRKWIEVISANPDVMYWVIEVDGEAAGVINYTGLTKDDGIIGWAYYIGEQRLRSMKTALALEMSMYDYAFKVLNKEAVISDVFTLNSGVIALHKICGCEIIEEKKNHVSKNGECFDVTFMQMTKERWLQICDSKKYEKISFGE